jgi:ribosomal protein S27AE
LPEYKRFQISNWSRAGNSGLREGGEEVNKECPVCGKNIMKNAFDIYLRCPNCGYVPYPIALEALEKADELRRNMNNKELKKAIVEELTLHISDIIFNQVKELPTVHSKRQRIDYIAEKIIRKIPEPDKPELLKRKLQTIVERIHFDGWERGKKQHETPYDFTLTNDDWLEERWKELLDLIPDESKQYLVDGDKNTITPITEPVITCSKCGDILEAGDDNVCDLCREFEEKQVLTEAGIVEVLKSFKYDFISYSGDIVDIDENIFPDIASQILQDKGWEVVGKGKADIAVLNGIDWSCNKKLKSELEGKEIEIAVREVSSMKNVDYISACPKCGSPLMSTGKCSNEKCDYVYGEGK